MVFSYCLKIFSVTTNNFWSFSGYCSICLLFDSMLLPGRLDGSFYVFLKTYQVTFQFRVVTNITEIIKCSVFSLNNVFILLLNHGGPLSLHTIVSWGINLLRMLRTVLLKITTFSLTLVFKKALCQSNFSTALFITSVFASL